MSQKRREAELLESAEQYLETPARQGEQAVSPLDSDKHRVDRAWDL